MLSARRLALYALLLVAPTACTTRTVEAPPPSMGAQLSVERFMQAANQRDVVSMGHLFGTSECLGPIRVEDDLNQPGMVSKIDEDDATMVSTTMNPAAESHGRIELFSGYNPTGVSTHEDLNGKSDNCR